MLFDHFTTNVIRPHSIVSGLGPGVLEIRKLELCENTFSIRSLNLVQSLTSCKVRSRDHRGGRLDKKGQLRLTFPALAILLY